MKVLKFGGTSVGSVSSINNVKNIIETIPGKKVLVLSAMSGVTNHLVTLSDSVKNAEKIQILQSIDELQLKHLQTIDQLIPDETLKKEANLGIEELIKYLKNVCEQEHSGYIHDQIITVGESLLTFIFSKFLNASGIKNALLNAKQFMQVNNLENPNTDRVGQLFNKNIAGLDNVDIYITQGFVRIDKNNRISTLKRGGSDYTATILGAALNAEEVQIWTDIDGFHNNDPRFVENTRPLSQLTFEEAAELAYFGAKILHPQTVSPVIDKNIPIILKNTFTPDAGGTKISSEITEYGIKAISAKDEITAIKIKSNRMLMAHGFLRKIFDVFDQHETAIDMITTSEIAISLTIDDTKNLDTILKELDKYGEITVDHQHTIICIVGEGLIEDNNTYKIFEILNDIPVRMISYGGSRNNVSLLVDTKNKISALKKLHEKLFSNKFESVRV